MHVIQNNDDLLFFNQYDIVSLIKSLRIRNERLYYKCVSCI